MHGLAYVIIPIEFDDVTGALRLLHTTPLEFEAGNGLRIGGDDCIARGQRIGSQTLPALSISSSTTPSRPTQAPCRILAPIDCDISSQNGPRMDAIATKHRDPNVTVQKSDSFVRAGLVLFGARWKAPMARALGVTRETVSQWVSAGDVPPWATNVVRLMNANKGAVLSLCDRTGNMVRPWAQAGFECFCVDLQHPEGEHARDGIAWIGADVRAWLPPPRRYAIVFAAPPCTNLAVSGARWFKEKGMGGLTEAIEIVESCRRICEWSGAPWMIENPVSTLGSYWRRPNFSFHPNEFGGYEGGEADDYVKRTCLWTGGGFRFPQKREIPAFRPLFIHNMPPSDERGDIRSVTPPGFARAVFEANVGTNTANELTAVSHRAGSTEKS